MKLNHGKESQQVGDGSGFPVPYLVSGRETEEMMVKNAPRVWQQWGTAPHTPGLKGHHGSCVGRGKNKLLGRS